MFFDRERRWRRCRSSARARAPPRGAAARRLTLLCRTRGAASRSPAAGPATLGLRVPDVPALAGARVPVLQSSANHAGGADARPLADVPDAIREGADLVLDARPAPWHALDGDRPARYEARRARGRSFARAPSRAPQRVARALGIVGRP